MGPLGFLFWVGLALFLGASAQAGELPAARDLHADARIAAHTQTPILVFFAADGCPYCQQVEELYLGPLNDQADTAGRVLIRVVHTTRAEPLTDFEGRPTDHERFARRERSTFTPAVRLYAPSGRQLTPPLLGYSVDFYGGMLERAIDDAVTRLRGQRAQAGDVTAD